MQVERGFRRNAARPSGGRRVVGPAVQRADDVAPVAAAVQHDGLAVPAHTLDIRSTAPSRLITLAVAGPGNGVKVTVVPGPSVRGRRNRGVRRQGAHFVVEKRLVVVRGQEVATRRGAGGKTSDPTCWVLRASGCRWHRRMCIQAGRAGAAGSMNVRRARAVSGPAGEKRTRIPVNMGVGA